MSNSIKDKIVEILPETIPKDRRQTEIIEFFMKGQPKTDYPYLIVAELYFLENNPSQALAVLKDGISQFILPYKIHLCLAKYYQQQKEVALAIKHYKSALKYDTGNYKLNLALLEIYYQQKRYRLALEVMRDSGIYPQHIDYQNRQNITNYVDRIKGLEMSKDEKIELVGMLSRISFGLKNYGEAIFYEKVSQELTKDEDKIKKSEARIGVYEVRQKEVAEAQKRVIVYDLANSI